MEFSTGVNVIVGSSDSGKSSVIRALWWVAENRPAGDEFRSDWADKEPTVVEVQTGEGDCVERFKSKTSNYYDLNGNPYAGFGQEVPEPVAKALNLADINIQQQHDAPYLLAESPGQVARTLNQIVHLDKIDSTLANIESRKREVGQKIKAGAEQLEGLNQALSGFPDLEAAEEFVKDLEETERQLRQTEYTRQLLTELQRSIWNVQQSIATLEKSLPKNIEGRLEILQQKQAMLAKVEEQRNRLSFIQTNIGKLEDSTKQAEIAIIDMKAEFKRKFPDVCPLCERPL